MSDKKVKTLSCESTVVAKSGNIFSQLLREVIVLNPRSGVYFGLDSVGSEIWNLIQQERSVSEINEMLLAEYDVHADQCAKDVLVFLSQLTENDLIEVKH